MICLAPLVLIGHLLTIQTPWHKTANLDGQVLDVQSCETGLGLHVKASTSGLYALGTHYGWTWHPGVFSLTLQPRVGLSHVDRPVEALPMRTQFELGTQVLIGYDRWRVGIEYWHLSNAGLMLPNVGLDMIGVLVGVAF